MPKQSTRRFAYFITPHGYGHAARSAAVINAIQEMFPGAEFEIFTRVPAWFFEISLRGGYTYRDLRTDIGVVQTSSTEEDLGETIRQLDAFLPFPKEDVTGLAEELRRLGCEIVLCDIAPLGIAVARAAGLPAVLIENFTWDWIYEGYRNDAPGFALHIQTMRAMFAQAHYHIRTEPACATQPKADLESGIVRRKPRSTRAETRQRLGVAESESMVLITMGGIVTKMPFLSRLQNAKDLLFLVPGGSETYEKRGSLVLIPHHSNYYHPDLVEASDAVIGKLGYSTLAEAAAAGAPYGFIPRARFRESAVLAAYAKRELETIELSETRFFSGEWLDLLPELLGKPRRQSARIHGAEEIADFVLHL